MRAKELKGLRTGKLVVVERVGTGEDGRSAWLCLCDCGTEIVVSARKLTRKKPKQSCGCLVPEQHGMYRSHEYGCWTSMRKRCRGTCPEKRQWYYDRGISVCPEWDKSFAQFLNDMGPAPSAIHSIDRIDNNGNYEPSNCRWASVREQARNRRTNTHIEYMGELLTHAEWAERIGIAPATLRNRLKSGWSIEKAFTEPLDERRRPCKK